MTRAPQHPAAPPGHVVVLRALGLGDFLTGLPALRALRRAHPAARITLAAPAALAPLATLDGSVDEVAATALLAPLAPPLHHADLAVNLHGSGPESHRVLLAARPSRLLAFAHPAVPESADGPAWDPDEHERARWCRLVGGADPDDLDLPVPPVPSPAPGATIVHPGAGLPSKQWPAARFAAVARALEASGHRIVVTGGPGEVGLARTVAVGAGLGAGRVLAGSTGLLELAALVAGARLVLAGDTGIVHLATALGTPSVALFGPVPPSRWGPPPGRPHHRVLWTGTEGDVTASGVHDGLLRIGVDEVLAAVPA